MKRKIIALLMIVMMLSVSIVGCGSKDSGKTGTGTSTDENTITVWAWDKPFNIYAMEEAEKVYQQSNPDFNLEIVEVTWDDMQQKIASIVGSGNYGELPDILLMQDYAYQKYCTTYPDLFLDITDTGIDFSQFSEGKLANSMVDGRNYGVPFDNGTDVAAYRTDVLAEAGYKLEDLTDIDWNRFIEIGKDVYSKTGYNLLSTLTASSDFLCQMLSSTGVDMWNEDGTVNFVNNDVLKQCISIYKELIDSKVMVNLNSWDQYQATFTSGTTAGVINGCWIMSSIQTAQDLSGKWGITNIPSVPGVATATNYSFQGGSTWAITQNCQKVDLAADFLAKTFAGSVELYETILPGCNALSTWLPASDSEVYGEPQEYYGGQAVFQLITEFAEKTPSVNLGVYYVEANTALATCLSNVVAGADIDAELEIAQDTVEFAMQ